MAIIIGDSEMRTLEQPIYVNGKTIKEVYCNGVKCYPEDVRTPNGRYVLSLYGYIGISYSASAQTKFGWYSWFFGWNNTKFEPRLYTMTGRVELTVVSKNPIAVYRDVFNMPTSEFSSLYGSGSDTVEYENYFIKGTTGHVHDFPKLTSSIAFKTTSGGSHGESLGDCECSTHLSITMSGMNTYRMWEYTPTAALGAREKASTTDLVWGSMQGRNAYWDYHDTTSGSDGMTIARVAPSSLSGYEWIGDEYSNTTCGYKLYGKVPVKTGGIGPGDAGVINDSYYAMPICIVPFTGITYNNNPSVDSLTFASDPPTEEASDEQKVPCIPDYA